MNPTRARRIRQVIITAGIAIVALAAFTLSFDAQTILALAAGADPHLGWIYPLTVDAAIVIVTLIALWSNDLARRLRAYLWIALGLWTAASVAGNALHILALPHSRVTIPIGIALAVNTVPAVTLFLTIHIATTTVFRPRPQQPAQTVTATVRRPRGRRQEPTVLEPRYIAAEIPRTITRDPIVEQLIELNDQGLPYSAIAERVHRSKSWVGEQIKAERDRLAAETEEGTAA